MRATMIPTVFNWLFKARTWSAFRFRSEFTRRAWAHAERLFSDLFPNGYDGEVFLCGGAFKPLLKQGLVISDIDLFVRTLQDREKLCAALLAHGAFLIQEFPPNCIKFWLKGQVVEVAYHDVESGSLDDLLSIFDLALCGIGSRYAKGRVSEVQIRMDFWNAVRHRSVNAQSSYLKLLISQKDPRLLSSLHRMVRQAVELNYRVNPNDERLLWEIYWDVFTEMDRLAATDYYVKTIVQYKGWHDGDFLGTANSRPLTICPARAAQLHPPEGLWRKMWWTK